MSETMSKKEVVITQEDFNNIEGFFENFKLPMPDRLVRAIKTFKEKGKGNYTFEDQMEFRAAIAFAFYEAKHPLLSDALFDPIREKCHVGFYGADFSDAIKDILSEDEK